MAHIDLSVVIACYNIGPYLTDCLDSLVKTQFPHDRIEILPVDDGSTDGVTPQIIDRYAKRYYFVKALHKQNGGLSDARNYGMDRAHGRYIAFVDGDDIVPVNAYSDLMYTAEKYHSKIVTGFVRRFDNLRNNGSWLHKFGIKNNEFDTTIRQSHNLLYDTTAWNKIWQLSFLRKNHLRFIKGILYEDLPFSLETQLKSDNSSVITSTVYMWRWRTNSITDSRGDLNNFMSRLSSLKRCQRELFQAGFGPESSLYQDFLRKILRVDIPIFLQNCGDAESSYVYQLQETTYRFLRNWHLLNSPLLREVPVKDQILYYSIKTGNLPLLKKYTYIKNKRIGTFKTSRFGKHYRYEIPGLSNEVLKYLNFRNNTLSDSQTVNKIKVRRKRHMIKGKGMFRFRHAQMFKKPFTNDNYNERIGARLVNVVNHKSMPITFYRRKTPRYKRVFRPKTTWTNTRYRFRFDYDLARQKLGTGIWMILIHDVLDNKYYIDDYLGSPSRGSKELFKPIIDNNVTITDQFNTNWRLIFNVRPYQFDAESVSDWVEKPQVRHNELIFQAHLSSSAVQPIIEFNDQHRLKGRVSSHQIIFPLDQWPLKYLQGTYSLRLIDKLTNHVIPYHFRAGHDFDAIRVNAKRQLVVLYNSRNTIRINYSYRQLLIKKWSLEHLNNGLTLRIKAHLDMPYAYHLYPFNHLKIEMLSHSLKRRYLLTIKKNYIQFKHSWLRFDIPLLSQDGKQLLKLKGHYHFIVYLPIDAHHVIKTGLILPDSLKMPRKKYLPIKTRDAVSYRVTNTKVGHIKLIIRQPWTGHDRSRAFRAMTYTVLYPLMRLLPIRNVMAFDSYWASQFSSNERAIYQYVQKHYPHLKTVWFFHNRQTPITGNGERVRFNSLRYWYYMATAKYLFQNANFPDQYLKRSGQIEVETLHGTFLKHMGFDEPHFRNASRRIQDNFARRNRRWDYMVVPSNYMRRIASHAFDYHQKILPTGFPRDDDLIRHDNSDYINKIKHRLNIPNDKKVILYAPTFRQRGGFNFALDLDRLEKALSSDYVLLVRLHYFVAHSGDFYGNPGFVYDVSDYPDINDLYLISDVLVTDYSSVMFDYAYLKRPMIFYAYDKDWYLNNHNRGTYLDYDHSMPGPIVETETDLIKELLNLDHVKSEYHQRIVQFSDRFAQFGRKGDASQKVTQAVLNTKSSQLDQESDRHVIFNKFWHWFRIKDLQSTLLNYLGQVLPKRNIMMFDSFFGTQYSDNPKAIYRYVRKHYPQYKCYWDVNLEDVPYFKRHHLPYIKRFGYRGLIKQAEAKYWIVNARRPFRWIPGRGTTVLQTWHGTPLKTIGADVSKVTMPGNNAKKYHKQVYEDNRRWNYLLAPNMYSERIMQRCFRMEPRHMMLTGYPRNDVLVNHNDAATINRIKDRLHIPHNKKVILYAPTWRDDSYVKSDEYVAHLYLDLDKFRQHYGNRVVVLVRTHYMISNHLDLSKYRDVAMNVSDYPDIADLYLISDVLITDYSSVMFDYAILKRPMIFFDYDFQNYAESTRGFYFDFRKIAPGPIVTTTDQVIAKLDPMLQGHWQMSPNYQRFVKTFTQWMDGKSSARVVHQLFSGRHFRNHYLTCQQMHLPTTIKVRDGALMWKPNQKFLRHRHADFDQNYDNDDREFQVRKGLCIQSLSFHQDIGPLYVLVNDPRKQRSVWISRHDVINL